MSAFELLSENDKEMLESYIKEYGPMNMGYFDVGAWGGLEKILNPWDKAKSKFLLKLFDNNLILSRPYSYLAQEDAISLEINKRMGTDYQPRAFVRWFEDAIRNADNDVEIYDFQGNNVLEKPNRLYYSKWHDLRECMTSNTLAANKYTGPEIIVEFKKSGHKLKIFKGMKPMKILHTLIKEFNGSEEMFDDFRIWHSMKLNQKRMDGEICLSIHPMDYITMSDNDNDWKSCMRWTGSYRDDHGDYRSGSVQCLNSPFIVVAYLHNKSHTFDVTDNYSWNSKQWRELFIVQEGVINEIKGYPFQDENLTQTVLMWLKELASKNLGWEYDNEEVNVGKAIHKGVYLTYDSGEWMYKDIGSLGKHSGRVNLDVLLSDKYHCIEYRGNREKFITIPYGGEATCMCCGNHLELTKGLNVFCAVCDDLKICPYCGEPIADNDSYYVNEFEDPICYECYSNQACVDSFDDSVSHLSENMTPVYLLLGFDENKQPIVYEEEVEYTYEPKDNWGYQDVFNECPSEYYNDYGTKRLFVSYDMVDQRYNRTFFEAYNIWPRDWDKFYTKVLNDYPEIVYSYDNKELRELYKHAA